MREARLALQLDPAAPADARRGRHSPTPSTVRIAASSNGEREERRRAGRRGARRRARGAQQDRRAHGELRAISEHVRRASAAARAGTAGRLRGRERTKVRLEDPLELDQRLLVEHDVVDVRQARCRRWRGRARRRAQGSKASCLIAAENRSSWAAATIRPSRTARRRRRGSSAEMPRTTVKASSRRRAATRSPARARPRSRRRATRDRPRSGGSCRRRSPGRRGPPRRRQSIRAARVPRPRGPCRDSGWDALA